MSKLSDRLRARASHFADVSMKHSMRPQDHYAWEAADALDAMEKALREIAAFDDVGANRYLDDCGSYGKFDEPGAVRIAREALAKLES